MKEVRIWLQAFWGRPTAARAAVIVIFLGITFLYCAGIATVILGNRARASLAALSPTATLTLTASPSPTASLTALSTAGVLFVTPTETPIFGDFLTTTTTPYPTISLGPTASPTLERFSTATESIRPTSTTAVDTETPSPGELTATSTSIDTSTATPTRASTATTIRRFPSPTSTSTETSTRSPTPTITRVIRTPTPVLTPTTPR